MALKQALPSPDVKQLEKNRPDPTHPAAPPPENTDPTDDVQLVEINAPDSFNPDPIDTDITDPVDPDFDIHEDFYPDDNPDVDPDPRLDKVHVDD